MTPKQTAAVAFISAMQQAIPRFSEDHRAPMPDFESYKQNVAKGDPRSTEVDLARATALFAEELESPWGNGDVQDFLVSAMHDELRKACAEEVREACLILAENVGSDEREHQRNWPR
jgi:hypothetical protein